MGEQPLRLNSRIVNTEDNQLKVVTELRGELTIYGCISSTIKKQNGYKGTLFDNIVAWNS